MNCILLYGCTHHTKENALLRRRKRPKPRLVVRERIQNYYHYLALCIYQLMEGGDVSVHVGVEHGKELL
jgi:hypothetical protein